jgi:beta-lactamase regulating signal transducer with metallopeptidase domain
VSESIARLNTFSAAWLDVMWAVAWQGSLLVAAAAAVCWMLRRQAPALRYWIWMILAGKLLLAPLWTLDVATPVWFREAPRAAIGEPSRPQSLAAAENLASGARAPRRATSAAEAGPVAPPAAPREAHSLVGDAAWSTWLLAAWTLVIFLEAARTARQYVGLKRLLARSRPVDSAVQAAVDRCALALKLSAPPIARESPDDGSPLVCGLRRPVLLLPAGYAARFAGPSFEQVVLHELAHLRRGDLWTIWIFHALRSVYWFHPLVHWVAYRAGLDRELACDQTAIAQSGASASAYARTLIDAAGRQSQAMALSAATAARLDGGAGKLGSN